MHRSICVLTAVACVGFATHLDAQVVLTQEEVIARARDQAGPVAVARARIAEAEASLLDASARFRDNPVLEASGGPRAADGNRSTDLELGISQQFETGGQRRARVAGAQATIARYRAEADATARESIFRAASAFVDAVAASQRLQIAEQADTLGREFLTAMERRYAAGDVAAIDVNLARIDAARSAATLRGARAALTAAVGTLRALLRLPATEPVDIRGTLDPRPLPPAEILRTSLEARPDLAALQAEAREAEAQIQLGRGLRRPDVGLRVGYEREETDTVVLGGLTLTLPAFQRGLGTLAAGAARASRSRLALETTRQAALAELDAALSVSEQHAAVAEGLARDALPSVTDNEDLARRSYDAGELNLMEFLLIRRDGLDTRLTIIDQRAAAARSRLTVDFISGVLR
jgi:outer membrane protein, heavy metal efflux system